MKEAVTPDAVLASDEALRRLAVARDREAWGALLVRHGARIRGISRHVLGDPDLAEDACQETLLQLRDHAARFRAPRTASDAARERAAANWILAVACRTALKLRRSRRRAHKHEYLAVQGSRRQVAASNWKPAQERLEVLKDELERLPQALREPVLLRYFAGMDYPDLARFLSCREGTAKMRVHRGLRKLRERLSCLGLFITHGELQECLAADRQTFEPPAAEEGSVREFDTLLDSARSVKFKGNLTGGGLSTMAKLSMGMTAIVVAGIGLAFTNGYGADQRKARKDPVLALKKPPAKAAFRTEEDRRGAAHSAKKAAQAKAEKGQSNRVKIKKPGQPSLRKKISVKYDNTPMTEVLADLSKQTAIPFRVSKILKPHELPPISLSMTDAPCELVLHWLTTLTDLAWYEKNGEVVISKKGPGGAIRE